MQIRSRDEFNQQLDQQYGVCLEYACEQAPWVGMCYGYSGEWAEYQVNEKLDIFAPAVQVVEDIDGETTNQDRDARECEDEITEEEEISSSSPLLSIGEKRVLPSDDLRAKFIQSEGGTYHRNVSLYLYHKGLNKLLTELDNNLTTDQVAILNCAGFIAGHATAFKKRQDDEKIEFFDCNRGKHIIPNMDVFKEWLPIYLEKNYYGYFYLYNAEIVDKEPASLSSTVEKSMALDAKRIFYTPAGMYHALHALGKLIQVGCYVLMKKFSNEKEGEKEIQSNEADETDNKKFISTRKNLHPILPVSDRNNDQSQPQPPFTGLAPTSIFTEQTELTEQTQYDGTEPQRLTKGC